MCLHRVASERAGEQAAPTANEVQQVHWILLKCCFSLFTCETPFMASTVFHSIYKVINCSCCSIHASIGASGASANHVFNLFLFLWYDSVSIYNREILDIYIHSGAGQRKLNDCARLSDICHWESIIASSHLWPTSAYEEKSSGTLHKCECGISVRRTQMSIAEHENPHEKNV